MDVNVPDYLFPVNFVVRAALLISVIGGLWFAVHRSRLAERDRLQVWVAVSSAVLAWFFVAWWFGSANAFLGTPETMPRIQYALIPPIVIGLFLLMRSDHFAMVVDATPQAWLTSIQIYRSLGAMFLVLWATGHMPGAFALPAGIGDVVVGLTAPLVGWLNARRSPYAPAVTAAWNLFGIADLVVAVSTGFLTSPSPLQMLAFDEPNVLITAYPLVMVPAFLVPVSIILHVLSLWKLWRERRTAAVGELQPA